MTLPEDGIHYHVMITEDEEIRTYHTPAEARAERNELHRQGWSAYVEICGADCPSLYHRPFDPPSEGSRSKDDT